MKNFSSRRVSKLLSRILRHSPEEFGIVLDREGWTGVEGLLRSLAAKGRAVSRAQLEEVVLTNDKQRFAFSPDGSHLRAQQGHSVSVELNHPATTPPAQLYHGTVERFLASIRREGLMPRSRHHVHLSDSLETAEKVGGRRGEAVVLVVDAAGMAANGATFFLTPRESTTRSTPCTWTMAT